MARQMILTPRRNFFTRRSPWGLIDLSKQMEDMERNFARIERDMSAAFRDGPFGSHYPFKVHRFFEPSSRFFTPLIEGETKVGENGGKYVVKMELGKDFNPENVKVSLKDRVLTIEAKFEQKSEDGNSRIYQEICKSFTLPEMVKVEEVKSLFTPEGDLLIEAPLPEVEAPKPKEIPISVENKK